MIDSVADKLAFVYVRLTTGMATGENSTAPSVTCEMRGALLSDAWHYRDWPHVRTVCLVAPTVCRVL
jgi:hypothetical protein